MKLQLTNGRTKESRTYLLEHKWYRKQISYVPIIVLLCLRHSQYITFNTWERNEVQYTVCVQCTVLFGKIILRSKSSLFIYLSGNELLGAQKCEKALNMVRFFSKKVYMLSDKMLLKFSKNSFVGPNFLGAICHQGEFAFLWSA
jgi:hypothetical protein